MKKITFYWGAQHKIVIQVTGFDFSGFSIKTLQIRRAPYSAVIFEFSTEKTDEFELIESAPGTFQATVLGTMSDSIPSDGGTYYAQLAAYNNSNDHKPFSPFQIVILPAYNQQIIRTTSGQNGNSDITILGIDFTQVTPRLTIQTEQFVLGESAFQAYVRLTGFTGTEQEWLDTLQQQNTNFTVLADAQDGDTLYHGVPGVYTGVFVGENKTENPGIRVNPIANNNTSLIIDTNNTSVTGLIRLDRLTTANSLTVLGGVDGTVLSHQKQSIVLGRFIGANNRPDPTVRIEYLDVNRVTLRVEEGRTVTGFLQLFKVEDTAYQKVLAIPNGSVSGYVITNPFTDAPIYGRFIDASNNQVDDVFLVHNGTNYTMQTELPTFSGSVLLFKL